MQIGIGLPNPIPGTPGRVLIEWARRAETRGFSTLATIDRIAFPGYESLVTLAAAAAVTQRTGLMTDVLLGPTRNPVLLAKEAASVDQLSGGRLVLGLGVGSREDDFLASGTGFHDRGRRWDVALEVMDRAWRGELVAGANNPVTPEPVAAGRPPLVFGGMSDATIRRTVRWGTGWTAGGAAGDQIVPFTERLRAAWRDAGRPGSPRILALTYFAVGDDPRADAWIAHYYGRAPYASAIAANLARTPVALRDLVHRYEDRAVDELLIHPTIAEASQVDGLADAVL